MLLLLGSTVASGCVRAAQPEACFLIITEHWPQSTLADPKEMAQTRDRLFHGLGVLVAAAYQNGGYSKNPTSFPVHHLDFRDDHIVIDFRASCVRARLFASELLQAYRKGLSAEDKLRGPNLVVEDKPATKYEALCGVGATAATCD